MDLLILCLFLAAFVLAAAVSALNDYHMFQLNSYHAKAQFAWLKKNLIHGYLLRYAPALLPLLLFLLPVGVGTPFIVAAALYLLLAWFNHPKKTAKKPLVYTPRVRRMLITHGILLALTLWGGFAFSWSGLSRSSAVWCAVAFLLTPVYVLASNLLNQPMEHAINRWYINDAKRMIQEMPGLTVIGVTGSYGKTSTKYFLQKLLGAKYNVLMTPESYNTTLGVVKTVRTQLKPTHEVFICEMGAKGVGEIKEICDIVHPTHGVLTSIGPQHLETFHSIENVIKTKFELADAVPEEGAVFLNYDNDYIRKNACSKQVVAYGLEGTEGCAYTAHEIRVSSEGSSFAVHMPDGEEVSFTTRLIGMHNVENIVGAIAVADYFKVPRTDIVVRVRRLESVPHRLQLFPGAGEVIVDDSYNSNPNGAKAALATLAMFEGCKILVTPGMIELGKEQELRNREFGQQAAAVCDYVGLVGERQTKPIYEGLLAAGYPAEKIFVGQTLQETLAMVRGQPTGGAQRVILLENDLPDNY